MNDLDGAAGRTLMVGLPGVGLDAASRELLTHVRPGGVILFARNLETPEQTAALIRETRALVQHPLLVALDQEGGRVSRLSLWLGPTPTAADLARAGVPSARRFGGTTAKALATLGFDVDFAPVVDLSEPTATNGIGDRSFGTDPRSVARLAGAFLQGLQEQGIAGSLKHFPGLGATRVDSHVELPTARRNRATLDASDLLPFRTLAPGAASVMVGHAHYPDLDPTPRLPATLSRPIVTGLLREELGFRGLVVSDDLEMGAVAPLDHDGQAAVEAVSAGCDLILYCADADRALRARQALVRAAGTRREFAARLVAAADTVSRVAARTANGPAPAWDDVCREMAGFAGLCRTSGTA